MVVESPPIQRVPAALSQEMKRLGHTAVHSPHLVLWLRMSGAALLLPPYMPSTRAQLLYFNNAKRAAHLGHSCPDVIMGQAAPSLQNKRSSRMWASLRQQQQQRRRRRQQQKQKQQLV